MLVRMFFQAAKLLRLSENIHFILYKHIANGMQVYCGLMQVSCKWLQFLLHKRARNIANCTNDARNTKKNADGIGIFNYFLCLAL